MAVSVLSGKSETGKRGRGLSPLDDVLAFPIQMIVNTIKTTFIYIIGAIYVGCKRFSSW